MKTTFISIIVAGLLIVVAIFLTSGKSSSGGNVAGSGNVPNVTEENGIQVIEVLAKGGYSPNVSIAKSGVATILRMKTGGTFDCSSSLVIPSLGFRASLPPSGTKDIEIPAQSKDSVINATCAMGMYNFQIRFI